MWVLRTHHVYLYCILLPQIIPYRIEKQTSNEDLRRNISFIITHQRQHHRRHRSRKKKTLNMILRTPSVLLICLTFIDISFIASTSLHDAISTNSTTPSNATLLPSNTTLPSNATIPSNATLPINGTGNATEMGIGEFVKSITHSRDYGSSRLIIDVKLKPKPKIHFDKVKVKLFEKKKIKSRVNHAPGPRARHNRFPISNGFVSLLRSDSTAPTRAVGPTPSKTSRSD